jgi:glyoxylase-like metal-dependent hydrolase (beta-lactamase superfamily II)
MMMKYVLPGFMLMAVLQTATLAAQGGSEESVMTFDIDAFQVSVLAEEQRNGRIDALAGVTPEMIQTYLPDSVYPSAVNAFLVRMPDKTILVDAGYGRKLFDHLQSFELTPEAIDLILLTHMHGDHIGGLLRGEAIAFPKAELYLSQPEYDYWMSDRAMQVAPDRRNGFLQARKVIAAYKDKLHLFVPGELGAEKPQEILPGVQGIAAYGHTPGHTAYFIESGGSRLLIWGDVNHAMRIQMPCPDVTYARDSNPARSVETRKRILAYVAAKKIPIAGMHIAFPGIGDVISTGGGGYAFEPYCLCMGF